MRKCALFIIGGLFFSYTTVVAAEIQYGHVEEVHDDELHIQYKGPSGVQNFVCDAMTLDCDAQGTTSPELFPAIDGDTGYRNSADGRYGIVGTETVNEHGSTTYIHTLYDVSGEEAVAVAVLPYTEEVSAYRFPWASDAVVLFGSDGTVHTFDIAGNKLGSIEPSQNEFPLRSLSPHAQYLSAYNYYEEAHKLWHLETGEEITLPSATPAYVEFSYDEHYAAYKDDSEGYQTVYVVDLTNDELEPKRIFSDDLTIEDYLWYENDLYAVGNTEDNPYRWVLYKYDPATDEARIISEQVSYGDYIRPVGQHGLSFLVIEGKNTHVALYEPNADTVRVIAPVPDSPASDQITRSVMSFDDGVRGVLYEPIEPDEKPELFVWLHGGPMRQTSVGYHSYLSYAVYDELLERLVESGAYVLKLDYAGSYGHGSAFMDQLSTALGVVDVEHVEDAAQDIQDEYDIDDIYLIGNSYGGYLGPKALVENERLFSGAIAINGVFDWFDLLERIPSSPFKTHFNGLVNLEDLDENYEMYEAASIVKELPDLPRLRQLLLIYGEDDATVPTWQTREFFYTARSFGKNADLLKLTGEGHIIQGRDSLNTVCAFISEKLLIEDLMCH